MNNRDAYGVPASGGWALSTAHSWKSPSVVCGQASHRLNPKTEIDLIPQGGTNKENEEAKSPIARVAAQNTSSRYSSNWSVPHRGIPSVSFCKSTSVFGLKSGLRAALSLAALSFVWKAPLQAAESDAARRFLSFKDGLASESRWLSPGKIDFLFRGREVEQNFNAFAWTPTFKGGAGFTDPHGGESTTYYGGFLRPLAGWPEKGDLILAAQGVDANNRRDFEAQGEYRLPFGLGVGGGFVEAFQTGNDVIFGKVTWRSRLTRLAEGASWNYILELQGQEVEGATSPGGYVAVYNEQVMGVFGHDGEQWRVTGGYVALTNRTLFRPAAEVLYVDNSIGEFDGPRSIFANATLRLQGGFLMHPARLGRAMGPQGLEFGNPLGFLFPTWNRRLETWEMGGLLDLRYERIWFPNRTTQDRFEGAVFPFQFAQTRNLLDYLFAGASYTKTPGKDTPGMIGGAIGKIGFLNLNVAAEYQFHPAETIVVLGLIDWF